LSLSGRDVRSNEYPSSFYLGRDWRKRQRCCCCCCCDGGEAGIAAGSAAADAADNKR